MVPMMEPAINIVGQAELFTVIGTSLNVYPAAGLVDYSPGPIPKWLVDPGDFNLQYYQNMVHIKDTAVKGMRQLKEVLNKLK
jgi:NAD-dependent deacetylase